MYESNAINLSPGLMQQFNHLKIQGHFSSEQDLLKASFEALERDLTQRQAAGRGMPSQPYMSHPGLSPDDYDT